MSELLELIRSRGWTVAVHNDYKSDGKLETYWLFIHPSGLYAEGSGETDAEALRAVWLQPAVREALAPPAENEESSGERKWDSAAPSSKPSPEDILAALPLMWAAIDRWNKRNGINVTQFDADILRAAYQDQLNTVRAAVEDFKAKKGDDVKLVPHVNTLDEEIQALDARDSAGRRARDENLLTTLEADQLDKQRKG